VQYLLLKNLLNTSLNWARRLEIIIPYHFCDTRPVQMVICFVLPALSQAGQPDPRCINSGGFLVVLQPLKQAAIESAPDSLTLQKTILILCHAIE